MVVVVQRFRDFVTITVLHAEFAERRTFFTEYMPFWRLEYDVFHGIRGIRVEYVRNTGRWEVIWNTVLTHR